MKNGNPPTLLFITFPVYPSRISRIKTLLRKKKLYKKKKYQWKKEYASLKTFLRKFSWAKPRWRQKLCRIYLFLTLNQTIIYEMMNIINLLYQALKHFTWKLLSKRDSILSHEQNLSNQNEFCTMSLKFWWWQSIKEQSNMLMCVSSV